MFYDRVKETTTTTGTGALTLLGAVTGFRSFAVVGNGNQCFYCIVHQTLNQWEVGVGTYTASGTSLSRDAVLASTAGGFLETFSAGTKDVFITAPAAILTAAPQPGGRLTTESGVPVSTSDRTGQSTLYYTPYAHDVLFLPDGAGSSLQHVRFTERSRALSGLTSGRNYDVWAYLISGTVSINVGPSWNDGAVAGSDTARGTGAGSSELERFRGVWVNKNALSFSLGGSVNLLARGALYLGTVRTTGTSTIEDSGGGTTTQVGGKRFVWNQFNQVRRELAVIDTTDSWTYSTAAFRQANGASGNRVEFVCGQPTFVAAILHHLANADTPVNAAGGIGLDSTTVAANKARGSGIGSASQVLFAAFNGRVALGYHALNWLEMGAGTGTQTWYGDAGITQFQSGLIAEIEG